MANSRDIQNVVSALAARSPTGSMYDPMTPARVKATGKQFGQKIGTKEAKAIAAVLKGWRK